jgi:hypothetical protein
MHTDPFILKLTGPAGGTYARDTISAGNCIEVDAIDCCRILSGRGTRLASSTTHSSYSAASATTCKETLPMPTHSGSLDPTPSPTEVIERFGKEVLNDKNLSAIDEIAAEDYVKPDRLPGQAPGRDSLKAFLETKLFPAFPDGQWINEEQVAEGEKLVTRFTFYGTHQGTFMGIPPTGRRVAVGGVVIDRAAAKAVVPPPTFPTTSTVLELITRLVAALSPTH